MLEYLSFSSLFLFPATREEEGFLIRTTGRDHPVFRAHFEGNPILPGFLQIALIKKVFNLESTSIRKSKFLAPVLPDSELLIKEIGDRRYRIFVDGKPVSEVWL